MSYLIIRLVPYIKVVLCLKSYTNVGLTLAQESLSYRCRISDTEACSEMVRSRGEVSQISRQNLHIYKYAYTTVSPRLNT